MNELVVADRASEWRRLKALVLDSVSSPITKCVYNLGPRSDESGRLRPQRLAPRPNPAAIYRGSGEDIQPAGDRAGAARQTTDRQGPQRRLSLSSP